MSIPDRQPLSAEQSSDPPRSGDAPTLASADRSHCHAAVFLGAGHPLELRRFPVPEPGPAEALVQVECCTLCGSDLHTIRGARTEAVPTILGHEVVGRIVRVGSSPPCDLTGVALQCGDRVTWSVAASCGSCDRCRRGMPQKCRTIAKYGHGICAGTYALSGGMAEMILLRPGTAICRVPAELPAAVAAPANCATATIVAAYRQAPPVQGQRVLIFGAGMLGLTAAAYAHHLRAASITLIDTSASRLALASHFGASGTALWNDNLSKLAENLHSSQQPAEYDIILELSGAADAVESAYQLADIGATIVLVGTVMTSRPVALDPERLVRHWLTLRGVHNYAHEDLAMAVSFLLSVHRTYPFDTLVTQTFALHNANQAVQDAIRDRPIRVAVGP